ncbi:MAG: sulfur carrier protein ThiS [Prevotella sp.]|jgi:sulfur carrier protein|nr:sulfur carrier protein ThiS [Prevotella sp.]MBQ8153404.1 sulfur carrier protein ThiS [Prevotella sp.]MBQ8713900.1 sulfur carrier protein ThiS [Prevotella sp.]
MAKIIVNGEAQEVILPLTLTELIKQNDVQQPEMVSVQVNEDFADRSEWDGIQIKEGDTVDFLYFMGGGGV